MPLSTAFPCRLRGLSLLTVLAFGLGGRESAAKVLEGARKDLDKPTDQH